MSNSLINVRRIVKTTFELVAPKNPSEQDYNLKDATLLGSMFIYDSLMSVDDKYYLASVNSVYYAQGGRIFTISSYYNSRQSEKTRVEIKPCSLSDYFYWSTHEEFKHSV